MERRNVTLSLPKSLLKKAKIAAVQSEKSLSALMREAIEEKVSASTGYQRAKRRHMVFLKSGMDLGTKGRIRISREDLHARR